MFFHLSELSHQPLTQLNTHSRKRFNWHPNPTHPIPLPLSHVMLTRAHCCKSWSTWPIARQALEPAKWVCGNFSQKDRNWSNPNSTINLSFSPSFYLFNFLLDFSKKEVFFRNSGIVYRSWDPIIYIFVCNPTIQNDFFFLEKYFWIYMKHSQLPNFFKK